MEISQVLRYGERGSIRITAKHNS